MSTSTDGLLVHGYNIGGGDDDLAFEEFTEDSAPPWFDEDNEDELIGQFEAALRRVERRRGDSCGASRPIHANTVERTLIERPFELAQQA